MLKQLSMLLAGTMVAVSLAGCGTAPSSQADQASTAGAATKDSATSASTASGTLTMWVWTDISGEIQKYEESHPGVKIEQVVIDAGDYLSKIQTTVASGGALPDLVWGEISNRGQLFSMDILDELTAEPYNLDTSLIEQSLLPTMQSEDGKTVGLERNITPSGLAYHRGLAETYLGTSDPDQVSAMIPDWDSFIEAGKKVAADSDGKVSMFSSLGDVYYIVNGQSDTGRITGTTIHKDAVEQLFTDICKFRDAGIVGKIDQWSPAWYASFGSQDAVFSPMPSFGQDNWLAPNAPDGEGDWAMIVPPGGGFSWGGTCWGITKTSQNKELAWDFVSYDCFGDGAEIRYQNGELPSATNFFTEEKLSASNAYFGGQNTTEIFIKDIVPTIHINVPTKYDYADICVIEIVLSSLNTDYSMTAQQAVDVYLSEMKNQAPELAVA